MQAATIKALLCMGLGNRLLIAAHHLLTFVFLYLPSKCFPTFTHTYNPIIVSTMKDAASALGNCACRNSDLPGHVCQTRIALAHAHDAGMKECKYVTYVRSHSFRNDAFHCDCYAGASDISLATFMETMHPSHIKTENTSKSSDR